MSPTTADGGIGDQQQRLQDADRRIPFRPYVAELWARRDYIVFAAKSQLRAQQMHTVLGNLWHLLNPALQIAVFYLIFGVILNVTRGVDNFIGFITVGLFVFQLSTKTITDGSKSIAGNRPMLRSIWFPRAMLTITAAATQLLSFFPNLLIMAVVLFASGESVSLRWLLIPPIIAIQTVLNLGLAFVSARLANHLIDIQQILPFVFRLLLYASGVLFLVDSYVEKSGFRFLLEMNPFYGYVSLWRWAMLGFEIEPHLVAMTLGTSVIALIAGFWWFRRGELGYTDGR
jgi:teichoic acid transport system permease protein